MVTTTTREERATAIAAQPQEVHRGEGCLWVRSQSDRRRFYRVTIDGCTCPDWTERQPVGGCKHMLAVQLWAVEHRLDEPRWHCPANRCSVEQRLGGYCCGGCPLEGICRDRCGSAGRCTGGR